MQLTIKVKQITISVLLLVLVGFLGPWIYDQIPRSNSKFNFQNIPRVSKWMGKGMSPFSARTSFEWKNEAQGEGLLRVELVSNSFVSTDLEYSWILPRGVELQGLEPITGTLRELATNKSEKIEVEVRGLNSNINQNLFLQLKSVNGASTAFTVAIPTRMEWTREGKATAAFLATRSGGETLKPRSLSRNPFDSSPPKGIQY